jgi:hypothetical protein
VLVRNSGVGFASLVVSLHLTRLVCENGMTAPLGDALVLKRAHRGLEDRALGELLAARLVDLPVKLERSAELYRLAEHRPVDDVREAVRDILRGAHLPLRFAEPILTAWAYEPEATAFGVSQAITRMAQHECPEHRFELERAAGTYLVGLAGTNNTN